MNKIAISKGVSPTIGVILIVALTVGLASMGSLIMFNSTDNPYEIPKGEVSTTDGNKLILVDKGDMERIYIKNKSGYKIKDIEKIGKIVEKPYEDYTVIGVTKTGKEYVMRIGEGQSGEYYSEPHSSEPDNLMNILNNMSGTGVCNDTTDDPYMITNDYELQAMSADVNSCYMLGNNIDTSGTDGWYNSKGFRPINNFDGELYGNNNIISGLTINRPTETNVGLIGDSQGYIDDIKLNSVDITGDENVGGFMGLNDNHAIIENSYASGTIEGTENVGGLLGINKNHATIRKSYSDGLVIGDLNIGGLIGLNRQRGNVYTSYANGTVYGGDNVGGLLGENDNNAMINNSYASGTISGDNNVAGLIGKNNNKGNVYNSYASGTISGNTNVGGLVGNINGDVINSYWDVESTGQGQRDSDEGTGLTTSEMTGDNAETNMVGFDFNDTWNTTDMYPILIDNNIVE